MESFDIQGIKVEFAQTSSSANPDQSADPDFAGIVQCAFHRWYRINGGEWRGGMDINMKQLLYELSEALGIQDPKFDGAKKHFLLDDEAGHMNEAITDTDRLNKLQNLSTGYGTGWILRGSTNGRGMRLHEFSEDGGNPSVRQAIDDYIPNKTGLRFDNKLP